MKKKQVKKISPVEIKAEKEVKEEIRVEKLNLIEVIDRSKLADLEKQGYIIVGVKGEVKGVNPKTWMLQKGAVDGK